MEMFMQAAGGRAMGRATSGVAQGCPASGLMFVVLADPILKRIAGALRQARAGIIRVCADDTAIALRDMRFLRTLVELFKEAEAASGLGLKPSEYKLIIVKPAPTAEDRNAVEEQLMLAGLGEFDVVTHEKCLGMAVGPGAGEHRWDNPRRK